MHSEAHTGRSDSGMGRFARLGVCALVLAVVTAMGAALGGGTFALLSAHAVTAGGVVRAGTAELHIDGLREAPLGSLPVSPAAPASRAVTIKNSGDADLAVLFASTAVGGGLAQVAMLRITPIARTSECAPGLTGSLSPIAEFRYEDVGRLAAGDTRVMCIEVFLPLGTSPEVSGESIDFALAVTGAQVNES